MNFVRVIWILFLLATLIMLAALIITVVPAHSHEWYAKKRDPIHLNGCCGGDDCDEFKFNGTLVQAEADGFRVRLTLAQSREINENSTAPIDALVIWDRVQKSEDGNWHMCIYDNDRGPPRNGVQCFFMPANM